MKSRIWVVVAAGAVLMGISSMAPASAQAGAAARRNAQVRREGAPRMGPMAALDLTDAQQAKIRAITQAAREKRQAIAKDTKLTPEKRRAAMQDLAKATQAKIKAVLTPAQRQKLEARQKQLQANRRTGRLPGQMALWDLDLTPAQQQKMRAIAQEYRPKFLEIRQSTALTQTQKAEQTRNLRRQQMDRIRAILTPEQRAKLDKSGAKPGAARPRAK